MYTTCLFCHSSLGANEVIESFPVGRRLAFDAAKGRLWVVCRKCERWNLTPLEERWEAIEQCERLFSSTRLKVSTDNIGMSRLREGLELVRIGNPQRPEMAAWRYGDQFGRRRMLYVSTSIGAGALVAGVIVGAPLLGIGSVAGGSWGLFQAAKALLRVARDRVVRTRVAVPGYDRPAVIRGADIKRIVVGIEDDEPTLRLPFNRRSLELGERAFSDGTPGEVILRGEVAMRAVGQVLPGVNIKGGRKDEIATAVQIIEATPDPVALFARSTKVGSTIVETPTRPRQARRGARGRPAIAASEAFIDRIPAPMRLAMEMAAHEDVERRAMEGELAILEAAWRQAEEVAAIADDMFVPASVDAEFKRLRAEEPLPRRSGN